MAGAASVNASKDDCSDPSALSLYTIKLKSACREPDLSLSGLDPVPLSKIGTHLFASRVAKEKIGTLLLASEMPVPIPR